MYANFKFSVTTKNTPSLTPKFDDKLIKKYKTCPKVQILLEKKIILLYIILA